MIKDIQRDCKYFASRLGNYQSMTPDELMNNYVAAIDSNNKLAQSEYLAAVVLRYWYTIGKKFLKDGRALRLEIEDSYAYLVEAINLAAKYRAWQNPEKNVNAQTCILQALNTVYVRAYYASNLDKNKVNYKASVSLESNIGTTAKDEKSSITLGDTLEDDNYSESLDYLEGSMTAKSYIQNMINNGKYVEAIILDQIAFGDTLKQTVTKKEFINEEGKKTKVSETHSEFWAHKLVKNLAELDENYKEYFTSTYEVALEPLNATLSKIETANNQKLYRYLRACLSSCQKSVKKALLG